MENSQDRWHFLGKTRVEMNINFTLMDKLLALHYCRFWQEECPWVVRHEKKANVGFDIKK
jgi:hypothetical protein